MNDANFFSRWSKRKLADPSAPEGPADADQATQAVAVTNLPTNTARVESQISNPSNDAIDGAKQPETAYHSGSLPTDHPTQAAPLPIIASLNPQSDFSPFMAKDVDPKLRNEAMKLLFTDPHYNVMDRLDIYIDDYNKPDPLPPEWLKNMNQSKTLRLFDDDEEEAKNKAEAEVESEAQREDVAGASNVVAEGPEDRIADDPLPVLVDANPEIMPSHTLQSGDARVETGVGDVGGIGESSERDVDRMGIKPPVS